MFTAIFQTEHPLFKSSYTSKAFCCGVHVFQGHRRAVLCVPRIIRSFPVQILSTLLSEYWWKDIVKSLEQCCLIELSTMMKCLISVHSNTVATSRVWLLSTWSQANVTEELSCLFYLPLINWNLSNCLWLGTAKLEQLCRWTLRNPCLLGTVLWDTNCV